MYTTTKDRLSPKVPRIAITKEQPRNRKHYLPENEEERVAWAAKILGDFTAQKRKEIVEKEELENVENEPQKIQNGDAGADFYQMCYMPIVLACILIGALMIGLVIYFVEEKPVITTDDPNAVQRVTESSP